MVMRLGLRSRILLFFVAIAAGATGALGLGLWGAYHHAATPEVVEALLQVAAVGSVGMFVIVACIWLLFDRHLARPIEAIASAMRARAHAKVEQEIDHHEVRYLGDLAAAASMTTAALSETRNALAETVARETARLSADNQKLAQLLADVPPAVLLCTGRHHLAFYNSSAQEMLATAEIPVCLGRSLFDYLSDGALRSAYQRLVEMNTPDAILEFVCTAPRRRRLAGRMRLTGGTGHDAGAYVLTLRDVTEEVAACARRDVLLSDVFLTIRPAIEALKESAHRLEVASGDGGEALIMRDIIGLEHAVQALEPRFEACQADSWPMAWVDASELAHQVRSELSVSGIAVDIDADALAARCNMPDIVSLFAHLARQIARDRAVRKFVFSVREFQAEGRASLEWGGPALSVGLLQQWLREPADDQSPAPDAILRAHRTTLSSSFREGRSSLSMSLQQVKKLQPVPARLPRTVTYDFELLSLPRYDRIAEARLDDLAYVVFDTETTGLFPERGDEIVQIAAVRIVNGKRVEGETFESLVNPGRRIPAASSAVHRITDTMVEDAPGAADVVRRFHRFCEGAVLVAHNAPFDMEFLYRRENELRISFANPILDTVLLSAVVFGRQQAHTLDALCQRLGVSLTEAVRHTAMGDAVATADAFLRLQAIIAGRGLERLGDLLAEVYRHRKLVPGSPPEVTRAMKSRLAPHSKQRRFHPTRHARGA
ncbi:DNA polymerase III epsilon subunit [Sinorhizobium alkalisoli]|nr:DNA polymerase III epsilon subunit [Sinorhizobium alkalisoli]